MNDGRTLGTTAKLFRGLGDVSRLKVLGALRDAPLSVGDLVRRTRLSQPNVSNHLACLTDCGLVTRERDGRFVFYALADKRVARVLDDAEDLLLHAGGGIDACRRYRDDRAPRGSRARRRRL